MPRGILAEDHSRSGAAAGGKFGSAQLWDATTFHARPSPPSSIAQFAPSPANVLSLSRHVPSLSGSATRSVAQNEARKRRASERHVVGCCEELAGACFRPSLATLNPRKSSDR